MEKIYLAGGCFWGLEELLSEIEGVEETRVGYMGGEHKNPTYRDICTGATGHAETVEVLFDDKKLPISKLLSWFFRMHDPTTLNSQGNDRGTQYRSAIFLDHPNQETDVREALARAAESGLWKDPIVTDVSSGHQFFEAEEEHQKYLKKNPNGYSCHFIRG